MLVYQQNKSERIAIWHEGALGDLVLSRIAIAAIRTAFRGKIFLYARNEVRNIFLSAGLVDKAFPTSFSMFSHVKNDELIKSVVLFASSQILLDTFGNIDHIRLICLPTRPRRSFPLALEQLFTLIKELRPEDREKILQKALKIGLTLEKTSLGEILFIHPGSGGRWKCAPLTFTILLFESFLRLGFNVRFILGPAEEDLLDALGPYDPIFCNNIREAINILSHACGFIGYDSGLTHLAAALGLPVIAIYGPTPWWQWMPFGKHVLVIHADCGCLKKGLDPRKCIENCLTRLSAKKIVFIINNFLKHLSSEKISDKYQEKINRQIKALESRSDLEKWLEYLGVKVVMV